MVTSLGGRGRVADLGKPGKMGEVRRFVGLEIRDDMI
jgi:hypothetical protein